MADEAPFQIQVGHPAPARTARGPLDARLPQPGPSFETEGMERRRLALVPPEVANVLLVAAGLLAPAAGFLPGWWSLGAAGVSMLLAALCGVVAPVPRFLAPRLAVSATLATAAGGGAVLVADAAQGLQEGWPKALAMLAALALSFVAGKPVGAR